jgi:hypothetical protein
MDSYIRCGSLVTEVTMKYVYQYTHFCLYWGGFIALLIIAAKG